MGLGVGGGSEIVGLSVSGSRVGDSEGAGTGEDEGKDGASVGVVGKGVGGVSRTNPSLHNSTLSMKVT